MPQNSIHPANCEELGNKSRKPPWEKLVGQIHGGCSSYLSVDQKGWLQGSRRVRRQKAGTAADLVQPPAQQQGLIFRLISAADVLMGKTTALPSLKRSSRSFSVHLSSPPPYTWSPRENISHCLWPHWLPLSLGSVWRGKSEDLMEIKHGWVCQLRVWPQLWSWQGSLHPKGKGGLDTRHLVASPGQVRLRVESVLCSIQGSADPEC
jgi:hypothetical protein